MHFISFDNINFKKFYSRFLKSSVSSALYTFSDIQSLIEYREEVEFTNKSVILVEGKAPILGILLTEHSDYNNIKNFTAFGRPIFYFEFPGVENNILNSARKKLINYVNEQLPAIKFNLIYVDYLIDNNLSSLSNNLIKKGLNPSPVYANLIDLRNDKSFLWLDIRKRHRKNIRWAEKNMSVKIFTSENCSMDVINLFKSMHIKSSGKQTRNNRTWEIQYEQIMNGEAYLVGGLINNEFVSFVFVNYINKISYYYSGASDRTKFDKPINHRLIWEALLFSKELGCHFFDMGEKIFNSKDEKLLSISNFKSGFTQQTAQRLEFNIKDSF